MVKHCILQLLAVWAIACFIGITDNEQGCGPGGRKWNDLRRCLTRNPIRFALSLGHVRVTSCRAREHCTAMRTFRLCCGSRSLPLMPEKVAECRKFSAVTAVIPTLGLGTWWLQNTNAMLIWGRWRRVVARGWWRIWRYPDVRSRSPWYGIWGVHPACGHKQYIQREYILVHSRRVRSLREWITGRSVAVGTRGTRRAWVMVNCEQNRISTR